VKPAEGVTGEKRAAGKDGKLFGMRMNEEVELDVVLCRIGGKKRGRSLSLSFERGLGRRIISCRNWVL
jgi:hypothetical protein